MHKKILTMFACISASVLLVQVAQADLLKVPSEFSTISSAMASAHVGDTILVDPGEYTEAVVMKESVRLIGSGSDVTTIIAPKGNEPAVKGASYSSLDGFKLQSSGSNQNQGDAVIVLNQVRQMTISNNKIIGVDVLSGISLNESHYNTIQFVTVRPDNKSFFGMDDGIVLNSSDFNHILNSTFKAIGDGILIYASDYNILEHNYSLARPGNNSFGSGSAINLFESANTALIQNTGVDLNEGDHFHSSSGLEVKKSPNTIAIDNIFYGNLCGIQVEAAGGTKTDLILSFSDVKGDDQDFNLINNPKIVYGSGIINVNPKINFNTGVLEAGSPCVNAGDPSLPHDPDGSIADLGAFYYQP